MTIDQDQIYIDKVLKGDTRAYAFLVDRYKDLVFTLALRMVKNRQEAEEISQDTFIKMYKSLSKFKGDSKFSTWVYRVAYNASLDHIKKQKRQFRTVTIDEFTEQEIKTLENALSKLEKSERKQAIQDCINKLPGEDAFIVTLYYFEEQSLEEISKIVNLKPNHLKIKLFRSRKKLATILKAQLEPEIIENYEQ